MKEASIIIGYQGLENSNNHRAAAMLAEKLPGSAVLEPLISSANVVRALRERRIQYGVMAVSATDGYLIPETAAACEGVSLETVDTVCLEIHHYLFKKNDNVPLESIRAVASHPAALLVCHDHIRELFPEIREKPAADTALAARQLSEGLLPEDTAVICSRQAGEQYGLSLIRENMQDRSPNGVNFKLFRLANVKG